MAGLGWQELVIVLVIIMIIFGAGKLPEIAKSLGQGVKEFREEAQAPVVPAKTADTSTATVTETRPVANSAAAEPREVVVEEIETVRVEGEPVKAGARDEI
jgi:sec-independent protein translocase protein TatA